VKNDANGEADCVLAETAKLSDGIVPVPEDELPFEFDLPQPASVISGDA
jgi:hypothetical protein